MSEERALLDFKASSKYYQPVISSRNRYIVLFGGRSSAKSHTACQMIVIKMISEKYFKGVVLRKVFADIKDSVFETVWSIICHYNLEKEFNYTKGPLQMVHVPTGNVLLARGLDKPAKLKSISNPNFVFIEEADEIQFEDFIKSDTSIRHPDETVPLQMVICFNPEKEESWINSYFFPHKSTYQENDGSHTFIKSIKKDTLILHTTYKHNDFTTPSNRIVIENLKESLGADSNYYQVYGLGLWGNALKGLVFENINFADKFPERENCKEYGFGLDFGFTNDPTAFIRCALAHGELWFEEIFYETGLVNSGSKRSIAVKMDEVVLSKDLTVADSAEPKSIAEIKRHGHNLVGVKKPKDSIESGITLMRKYKINVVGASPNLRKEFKSYKYKENKDTVETEFSNTPIDAWNHAMDAVRYWCWHNLNTKKQFRVL